ncbi:MAG: Hsp20/alpha crystallin family protein [Planctomycetaceae bacterium]|nr:Hsp20/alpha crystallin family protein [Planctomycetaceae bacterium]
MVRFRPFQNVRLVQLRDEVDRFMDECLGASQAGGKVSCPPVNVWEQEGEFVAEIDLPGYRQEDLEISVMGPELSLKGRRQSAAVEGVTYLRQERTDNEFARTLRMPADIDAEKVSASLENGVLRVTLPKAASARPVRVEIKGA